MANLQTTYLGMPIKNPLVAGASPLSQQLDLAKQLEDSGVGALVMYSLFEEEITHDSLELDYFLNRGTETQPEAQTYLVEPSKIVTSGDRYLEQLRRLKDALEIPVIASLNGSTRGGWISLAREIEAAGADALELNIYSVRADPSLTSDLIEKTYTTLVHEVSSSIHIPVAIKLSPFFTTLPQLFSRFEKAGAAGLVLFNRFMQPDIDIETLEVNTRARLSSPSDLTLPVRWIALESPRVNVDFALSGGVHSATEMIKGIMAGAKVTQVVSKFLKNGVQSAMGMLRELNGWMDAHDYSSIDMLHGVMAEDRVGEATAYERANYLKALRSYQEKFV